MKTYFIRNIEIDHLFDNFLVSAVSSILLIRFFLGITGYPQIGGSNFHIAHLLWGGLFMTVAFLMLLAYVSRSIKFSASIIGGIGFGVFIDELGKFITKDNNYFYQPTAALIYVIFIFLYLAFRLIEKHKLFTREEYLINGLEMVKEAVLNDMNADEKKQAIEYLGKSGSRNAFVQSLLFMLKRERPVIASRPHLILRWIIFFRKIYHGLLKTKWFLNFVVIFFVAKSIFYILVMFITIAAIFVPSIDVQFRQIEFLSSIISGLLVVMGVLHLRKSRLVGYVFFKRSVLVSIFLTQVFSFYSDQFLAVIGLGFNIFLLAVLDYMIQEESVIEIPAHI
ncbi:hypothetical protein A2866_04390 [Candidatus Roizmanbacteria bacterium RIFCSPHIGHO2_01_FULL_39_8]|uniref:Uncharacterized protein n=3 Tax=Candidatus Roizmaniibacteriota TaxID=1752723 RepID=A0A1F7GST3_9BACT|nr:MAG: hypothetical protein A2866_04390 [Candidatus Roizmanbacteria bacterium RIFCSPHIGHO2_01_FULL_39_8]OGK25647.1 MAG: hypothetical protein A3C28_00560 [Candidatus Roizmanbacteria bacterium RIFCSPHIGHO2_02_FULL_39_9]OGK36171.1 MAG: hypothetical protein A3F60_03070 [Candidatus Roizmanbacteria bacterium RIFCSPHIGHO2_12_FULL_39_8]